MTLNPYANHFKDYKFELVFLNVKYFLNTWIYENS